MQLQSSAGRVLSAPGRNAGQQARGARQRVGGSWRHGVVLRRHDRQDAVRVGQVEGQRRQPDVPAAVCGHDRLERAQHGLRPRCALHASWT